MRRLPVPPSKAGIRLDRYLQELFPGLSRQDVQDLIRDQRVFCNGQPGKKGRILAEGDCLDLVPGVARSAGEVRPDPEVRLEVLFEDSFLVGLAKPPGMSMHPLRGGGLGTLANGLVHCYPEMQGVGFSPREPGLVHRLDRETSGIVLAARRAEAFEQLRLQFAQGRVTKIYLAVVHGSPSPGGVVNRAIGSRGRRSSRVGVAGNGKPRRPLRHLRPAETRFQVVRAVDRFSVVRLTMATGARHQLRAHLAWIGHPVVGDRLYGAPGGLSGGTGEGPGRHLLHAAELRFFHPDDGRAMRLRCPLPADFQEFLERSGLA